jgi:hypothetical protein
MNCPRFAGLAAQLLSRTAPAQAAAKESDRAQAILLIERALAQKARRRTRRRWTAAGGIAMAAAATFALLLRAPKHAGSSANPLVIAIGQPMGSGAQLLTSAGSEPLRSGSPLPTGGRLVADAHGGAALRLSTGTEIAIEHDASLAFSDAGPTEHFTLSQGSIRARVAKLGAGERFIVSTPDAEVEVRGTVFNLDVVQPDEACGAGTRTRVFVSEGIVEVRSSGQSSFVHAGQSWPDDCGRAEGAIVHHESTPEPKRRVALPSAVAPPPSGAGHGDASALGVVSPSTASRLAEQNDLFSQGVAARRAGDSARAIAAFDTLLARYPSGALAESASVERMRVLAKTNHGAARRAAQEYLGRFGQGFARADAEAILVEP